MCEPVTISLLLASAALQSKASNDAAKANYNGKLQAQAAAAQQAMADRDATHQSDIRNREVAERNYSAKALESTLKAEELRGKALAQGATAGGVSSVVFDQQDRHIFMADSNNQTSNIWNLQNNARNLKANGESAFRKQAARAWQNRAGVAPTNTFALDMISAAPGAITGGTKMSAAIKSWSE